MAPFLAVILSWTPDGQSGTLLTLFVKTLSVPTLAVELIVITTALVMRLCLRGSPKSPPGFVLCCAAAWLGVAIATATWIAPEPVISWMRTSILLIHISFAWAIFNLCEKGIVKRQHLTNCLMGGLTAVTVALAVFAQTVRDPAAFNWVNGLPGFDNFRRTGYYAAPIIGLCIGSLPRVQGRRRWAFTLIVVSFAFALIFWTGTRGAVAAILASSLVGLVLFPSLRNAQRWGALGAAALAGFLLSSFFPQPAANMSLHRTGDLTSGRTRLWSETWAAIRERPFFGYGEGQVTEVIQSPDFSGVTHPHNLALQTLLAWGVVGTILLLPIAVKLGRCVVRDARTDDGETLPFVMGMIVILLYSSVDGTLFHVQSTCLFATFAGAALSCKERAPSNNQRRKADKIVVTPTGFEPVALRLGI
ncbi:MAG: O-antigen ligase family protein [Sphingosinicella sp.]|nr:O-antigen ligase family protein [Sphingosinicella sp.]